MDINVTDFVKRDEFSLMYRENKILNKNNE